MTDLVSNNPLERVFFGTGQPKESAPVTMDGDAPAGSFPRGSSRWWLRRLLQARHLRNGRLQRLRDYYRGENETWRLADRAHRDTFGERFKNLRANLAQPVVEVPEQRMSVVGFDIPDDDEGAERAWRIWTENSMRAASSEAHLEALSTGIGAVLVDPWRDVVPGIPLITIEDPLGVIVEHDVADRKTRLAALKTWTDDDGRRTAVLYLPERVEWWRTIEKVEPDGKPPVWQLVESEGGENPLGVVPMVELHNAPRARAEHEGIIDQLDQMAAALYRMATAAHYTSYRQKYAAGVDQDEEDVELDADGQPLHSRPAGGSAGPDQTVTSTSPDTRFGTFEQSDMLPFIREIEMHQALVATISSTPHRLILPPPSSVPPSGESVRLEDLPLTQKIQRKHTTLGDGWETVMRLAFLRQGDEVRARRGDMETVWKDPEPQTVSELMDALVKAATFGVPREELWRRYGATPHQIRRWRAEQPAPAVAEESADAA